MEEQAKTETPNETRSVAVYTEPATLAPSAVADQVQLIQQVMAKVMKEGEHYGKIPGCGDKPTLLKAGAEKLLLTFRLAPKYEELPGSREEDTFICYKIRCDLIDIPTARFMGSGTGVCNSREKKYKERSVFENQATPEEKAAGRLVKKVSAKSGKPYTVVVIPQDPYELQNTLYKMACKRALVAAILNVTAASDFFTQDLEEMGTVEVDRPKAAQPERQEEVYEAPVETVSEAKEAPKTKKASPKGPSPIASEVLDRFFRLVDCGVDA